MPHPVTDLQYKDQPAIGSIFTEFESIDSTNNYAIAQAHAGNAFHGSVYFAHEQTAGKGQRGKSWIAAPGENVAMSILLNPTGLLMGQQFLLSVSMALGCIDLLKNYQPLDISIKWPNDLYIHDRKAGGILIENIIAGPVWKFAVVGIGINVNQTNFDERLPNPVSLRNATGKVFDVLSIARELCACLQKRYLQLMSGQQHKLMEEYNLYLFKRDKQVRLRKGDGFLLTTIQKVTPEGILITKDDIERRFGFGEVQWVI